MVLRESLDCAGFQGPGGTCAKETTLLLPGVSFGNVGQLGLDVLLTTAATALRQKRNNVVFERVCCLSSPHVIPVVGNNPLGQNVAESGNESWKQGAGASTAIELFRIGNNCESAKDEEIMVLQLRSPILEGHVQFFVDELAEWIASKGFSLVWAVAGADSGLTANPAASHGQFSHLSHDLPSIWATRVAKLGLFDAQAGSAPSAETMQAPFPPASKAGILVSLRAGCKARNVAFLGLVRYVKEGINVHDGIAMACACNEIGRILPPATDGSANSTWTVPSFWRKLFAVDHRAPPDLLF